MFRNPVLLIDALVNLILGVALLTFRPSLAEAIGVPQTGQAFYPTMLGAVLFGIAVALLLECGGRPKALVGLGQGGAIAINLCGGVVLAIWLTSGRLVIPMRGQAVLWSLVVILVVISAAEFYVHQRRLREDRE